jgi:hypothetical protein
MSRRDDRRPAKPDATPEPESKPPEPQGVYTPRDYVIVLWVDPEMRRRNPDMPLSLHEALQVGREFDPHYPIPIPGVRRRAPDRTTELEAEP